MKSASVKCVGVFLMPSVLVALEESLCKKISPITAVKVATSFMQTLTQEKKLG